MFVTVLGVGILASNPLEPVGQVLVDHPLVLAAGLAVGALVVAAAESFGQQRVRYLQATIATPSAAPSQQQHMRGHTVASDGGHPRWTVPHIEEIP